MARDVYRSTTLGDIPLSFTGRHLLQTLRECVADALAAGDTNVNAGALSRARGRLAQYMSKLEDKSKDNTGFTDGMPNYEAFMSELTNEQLKHELDKRFAGLTAVAAARKQRPYVVPTAKRYIVTFLPKKFRHRLFDTNTATMLALGEVDAIALGKRVCKELCKNPDDYWFSAKEMKE